MPTWLTAAKVHEEEREHRHEAQREEIERAFTPDAVVDGGEARAEAPLHAVAEEHACREERERRANRGGERHEHRASQDAEERAAGQREHRRAWQGRRGHDHVDREERARRLPRMGGPPRLCRGLLRLERPEAGEAVEVEGEERRDQRHEDAEQERAGHHA
jgi:hypothetical protein